MLFRVGFVSLLLAASAQSQAQTVERGASPLPIFDLEGGIPFVMEAIIAPDTLQDIEKVIGTDIYDKSRIAARVEDLAGSGFCSGFRVGENLFMTNYHCWEVDQCEVLFHMGYEKDLPVEQQATFKCVEVLDKLESLDFALYRVEPVGEDLTVHTTWPVATLSKAELVMDMPLLIPGHPSARPKQVDISDQCKLTRAVPYRWYDRENIQHQCDTMGGNSGSPVLNRENGHVVAIHWGATGGTGSNHAIPMGLILDRLEAEMPDVFAELSVSNE